MEAHGGNIGVFSEGEDSGGSVFYIDIPVTDAILEPQSTDKSRRYTGDDRGQKSPVQFTFPKLQHDDSAIGTLAKKRRSIRDLLQGASAQDLTAADRYLELVDIESAIYGETPTLPPSKSSKSSKSAKSMEAVTKLPPISLPPYEATKSPKQSLRRSHKLTPVVQNKEDLFEFSRSSASPPGSSDSLSSSRDSWMSLSPDRFGITPEGAGKSILIVDDSPSIRKMAARLLRDMNADNVVDHASDGKVAVEKIDKLVREGKREYDVIMMDYMVSSHALLISVAYTRLTYVCRTYRCRTCAEPKRLALYDN